MVGGTGGWDGPVTHASEQRIGSGVGQVGGQLLALQLDSDKVVAQGTFLIAQQPVLVYID